MGMREEFEAYRDRRNALLESEGHKPGSKWHVTQAHYTTWAESRTTIVIELPDAREDSWGQWSVVKGDVIEALTDAGVSYK